MAAEEVKHAERWEKRLRELGSEPGQYTETAAETRKALVDKGPEAVVKVMEAAEDSANGGYETLAALSPTEEDRLAFQEVGLMERAHDRALTEMGAGRCRRCGRWRASWGKSGTSAAEAGSARPSTASTTGWAPLSAS